MMINKRDPQRRGPLRCLCVMLCMLIVLMPGADVLTMRAWGAATYTVTFHANGGKFGTTASAKETSEKTVTEGKTVTAPSTVPSRTGYAFTKGEWYTDPDCTTKWTLGTGGDTVTSDMTLYAKWEPKTYTVKFWLGTSASGTPYKTIENQVYGTLLSEPVDNPAKVGNTFDGWYTSTKYEQEVKLNEPFEPEVTSTATTVNLFAKWNVNSYKVTFDLLYDNKTEDEMIPFDSTITKTPERYGYKFDGWYKSTEFTTSDKWSPTAKMPANSMTLYAKWTPNKYKVTFDSQGGTSVTAQTIEYGSKCTLKTPTKTGYTLVGWYRNAECTEEQKWDFDKDVVTEAITLYAKWTTSVYTVEFNTGEGGSIVDPQKITHGGTVTRPSDPTMEHFDFDKWVKGTGTSAYNFDTAVTADFTLVAKWTDHMYIVAFDSTGGSEVKDKTAKYNNTVTKPSNPTRTGYTFAGWYKDEDCTTGQEWSFDTPVTGDVTLYAKWTAIKYDIKFDYNGGKIGSATYASVKADFDSYLTAPSTDGIAKTGYAFDKKWYTDEECTNEWNFADDVVKGKMTLYAGWKINRYTVTFDTKGGSAVARIEVEYNGIIQESPETTKTGHAFGGWFTDETCTSTKKWKFGDSTSPTKVTENITLYAKWTANEYTVTYDPNGGKFGTDINPKDYSVEYDKVITDKEKPSDPKMTGYTFAYWCKDAECNTAWDFQNDKVTGDITLYAKWTINGYKVSFYSDGAVLSEAGVEHGNKVTQPGDPTNEGKTFVGWVTTSPTSSTLFDFSAPITKDTKVYAKWSTSTTGKIYIINFSKNGHGITTSKTGLSLGQTITKPADPTAEGYTFGGWYKEAECNNAWNFDTDTVQKSQILYAKWTINTYTVNFDTQGGSAVPAQTVEYRAKATAPTAAPTREGYTFDGWYKEQECTNIWGFETDVVTGETTIYAKWVEAVPDMYTVSFDLNGHGSTIDSITDVVSGSKITAPTPPTAEGWTFGGWYKGPECTNSWDFAADTVTADTTLYAKWTEVVVAPEKYTVSFNLNGHGSTIDSITDVVSGGTIAAPAAPTAEDYTFEGWYKDAACSAGQEWNFAADTVTADTTLYAKWTKVEEPPPVDPDAGHEVIVGDGAPPVQAGGLDSVVDDVKAESPGASSVKITMTVEKKDETDPSAQQIREEAPAGAALEYLDIGITKDVDGAISTISSTRKVIEVKVQFDFRGKSEIAIYREHDGRIERFTESESGTDGTFKLDRVNGFIHIFAQKFSVYAISYKKESSPGGSSGGSTGTVSYMITASAGPGGSISPSGDIRVVAYRSLTLTVTPEEGYRIADVLVDGKSVGPVSAYTFRNVLAAHRISAVFEPAEPPPEPGCQRDESCPAWPYIDVNLGEWYHDGIHYCLEKGLMTGYAADRFGPGDRLTRAQLTQILYNLAGRPEVSGPSGFKDVPENAWYAKAVAWAREAGVVSGYSDTRFAPGDLITREQLAAMIWRYAGSPADPRAALSFKDSALVSAYAGTAMRWAVAEGIVSGHDGYLEPREPATRAQASSMIMRFCTVNA